MAVCTLLTGAVLNPLVSICSSNTSQQHLCVDRLSFSSAPSFSALPTSRNHHYIPPLCRHQPAAGASEAPPSSREEALLQARSSISVLLEKALRDAGPTTVKQRKLQRQARLRVELPFLDESEAARASFLSDLLFTMSVGKRGTSVPFSVFSSHGVVEKLKKEPCGNADTQGPNSDRVRNSRFRFCNMKENVDLDDSQVVVILSPKLSDVAYMVNIVKAAHPRPVLLLNPDWSLEEEEAADASHASFLQSFEVVYSYLPLAIQGFFSKTEGAILKHVRGGAPAGRPWLVFAREGESLKCVATLKKRPTTVDLENALYNAMAANSPVTKSIKFLRGLVGKEN